MDTTKQKKHEIIKRISNEIKIISESCEQSHITKQLITPPWNFNLDSILATTKHYESIMHQLITLQFERAKSNSLNIITPEGFMHNIANILILLNLAAELLDNSDK